MEDDVFDDSSELPNLAEEKHLRRMSEDLFKVSSTGYTEFEKGITLWVQYYKQSFISFSNSVTGYHISAPPPPCQPRPRSAD